MPTRNVNPAAVKRPKLVMNARCARSALRSILFRQPEGVHDEIGSAQTEQHGAHHEPRDRIVLHVKDVAERQPDGEKHHNVKKSERGPAAH